MNKINLDALTPAEIVSHLDRYIIGQDKAKKAVALALRNRVRRSKLPQDLQDEVMPRNIIMIGSTGVGKTEIARRLSKLSGAPFVKVEATKYTEVGYVGRDVESMVRDLMSAGVSIVQNEFQKQVEEDAQKAATEALLDILCQPPSSRPEKGRDGMPPVVPKSAPPKDDTREKLRALLDEGKLDDKMVEVETVKNSFPAVEVFSGSSSSEMEMNIGAIGNIFGGNKKKRKVKVSQAREILFAEQLEKLIDKDTVTEVAKERVENMGIIFIDEIDKIAGGNQKKGGVDVSREGVQRDILPIVEGSTVNTKYGTIDTTHILFIAAGAFSSVKPSDLIPELQGRFPLRVELEDLDTGAFEVILKAPENSLIKQYTELMKTEEVFLQFSEEAIRRIAEIASEVNTLSDNIGARRLYTVMELLLEEVSYTAPEIKGQQINITPDYVNERLAHVVQDRDLSRYIL